MSLKKLVCMIPFVIFLQGVIVLTRQWKNILYTPLLLEHNFKTRHNVVKPLNVTFAIPDADDVRIVNFTALFYFGNSYYIVSFMCLI